MTSNTNITVDSIKYEVNISSNGSRTRIEITDSLELPVAVAYLWHDGQGEIIYMEDGSEVEHVYLPEELQGWCDEDHDHLEIARYMAGSHPLASEFMVH